MVFLDIYFLSHLVGLQKRLAEVQFEEKEPMGVQLDYSFNHQYKPNFIAKYNVFLRTWEH